MGCSAHARDAHALSPGPLGDHTLGPCERGQLSSWLTSSPPSVSTRVPACALFSCVSRRESALFESRAKYAAHARRGARGTRGSHYSSAVGPVRLGPKTHDPIIVHPWSYLVMDPLLASREALPCPVVAAAAARGAAHPVAHGRLARRTWAATALACPEAHWAADAQTYS